MEMKRAGLSSVAFGVAMGVVYGLWMMLSVFIAMHNMVNADATAHLTQWVMMYPGVTLSPMGALTAGGWGLLEGFITGLVLAWIYNLCLCCCPSHCKAMRGCGDTTEKNN